MALSAESGTFWFFAPSNVELFAKVLDGRPVNGAWWAFATALTDLDLELRLLATDTGWERRFLGSNAQPLRVGDVEAFRESEVGSRILWVGAHPDDESLVAPLLGAVCGLSDVRCTLQIATRGENGTCRLPSGCGGDLGAVREAEMRAAAQGLGADLRQHHFEDLLGPIDRIRGAWDEDARARALPTLAEEIAGLIDTQLVDTVVTFDPRHGSTGHPAHRAVGEIVAEVLRTPVRRGIRHLVLATTVSFEGGEFTFDVFDPAEADARYFLASGVWTRRWQHLLDTTAHHPSQIDSERQTALERVPEEQRFVVLQPGRPQPP